MKLGCIGCLLMIILILVVLLAAAGIVFLSANIYGVPEVVVTEFTRSDGYAAQQKIFEVLQRESGRSSRKDPIVLSDREVNAFLSNHLAQSAGLTLSPLSVRFSRGEALVQGRTPLRKLLQGPPFAQILPYIPDQRLDRPVWVTLRGRLSVDSSIGSGAARYGKVSLTDLSLGKQPVSGWLLTIMMGPSSTYLLRWQVPPIVESIDIEEGQVVIRTR
jgi:hypothetical protein